MEFINPTVEIAYIDAQLGVYHQYLTASAGKPDPKGKIAEVQAKVDELNQRKAELQGY